MNTAEDLSSRFFTARERPSCWGHFRRDFFGLRSTESLTTSTLSGHLAVNFQPDLGFSAFFLRLFTSLWLEICVPNDKLFFFSGDNY